MLASAPRVIIDSLSLSPSPSDAFLEASADCSRCSTRSLPSILILVLVLVSFCLHMSSATRLLSAILLLVLTIALRLLPPVPHTLTHTRTRTRTVLLHRWPHAGRACRALARVQCESARLFTRRASSRRSIVHSLVALCCVLLRSFLFLCSLVQAPLVAPPPSLHTVLRSRESRRQAVRVCLPLGLTSTRAPTQRVYYVQLYRVERLPLCSSAIVGVLVRTPLFSLCSLLLVSLILFILLPCRTTCSFKC